VLLFTPDEVAGAGAVRAHDGAGWRRAPRGAAAVRVQFLGANRDVSS
jgi:hypothetical protein